jgi:DNA-binding CsgD family transcriptional regulator
MSYDLSKLTEREMVALRAIANCRTMKDAARLIYRAEKTMSSQKRRIKDRFDMESEVQWEQLCAQVRGEPIATTYIYTTSPEIWMSYVGACSLLSRLQRLVVDGDEAELIDEAIRDCAALSNGRLRVIRITNGVALEPTDARLDQPARIVDTRGMYEDAT